MMSQPELTEHTNKESNALSVPFSSRELPLLTPNRKRSFFPSSSDVQVALSCLVRGSLGEPLFVHRENGSDIQSEQMFRPGKLHNIISALLR